MSAPNRFEEFINRNARMVMLVAILIFAVILSIMTFPGNPAPERLRPPLPTTPTPTQNFNSELDKEYQREIKEEQDNWNHRQSKKFQVLRKFDEIDGKSAFEVILWNEGNPRKCVLLATDQEAGHVPNNAPAIFQVISAGSIPYEITTTNTGTGAQYSHKEYYDTFKVVHIPN